MTNGHVEVLNASFPTQVSALSALDAIRVRVFEHEYGATTEEILACATRLGEPPLLQYRDLLHRKRMQSLGYYCPDVGCIQARRIGSLSEDGIYMTAGDCERSWMYCTITDAGSQIAIATAWDMVPLWDPQTLRRRILGGILTAFASSYQLVPPPIPPQPLRIVWKDGT